MYVYLNSLGTDWELLSTEKESVVLQICDDLLLGTIGSLLFRKLTCNFAKVNKEVELPYVGKLNC